MKISFAWVSVAVGTLFLAGPASGQTPAAIGDAVFRVSVQSVEKGQEFSAYPDKNPPFLNKKTTPVRAGAGKTLVRVALAIDNTSDAPQSFALGDVQLACGGKPLSVVAAGLSDQPFAVRPSEWAVEKARQVSVESRKQRTGGSYRFPIYVFEAPEGCAPLRLSFRGKSTDL